jgi:hypothetical protein
MCLEQQDLFNEISFLRRDLSLTFIPKVPLAQFFVPKVTVVRTKRKRLSFASLCIKHVMSVSEKLERIGESIDHQEDLQLITLLGVHS